MTANTNLERRVAEHYASEPPLRAPDRVLHAALATIETTKQRRGLFAPWRFTAMSTYAKVAAAAVLVIAVGAIGLAVLGNNQTPGQGGSPVPTELPTTGPTMEPTAVPTVATYAPPPLSQTFTSDVHGLSIAYPEGWSADAATTPWTTSAGPFTIGDPAGDFLFDPARDGGHLFIAVASQPLGDTPFDEWSTTGALESEGCGSGGEPVVVDGADGVRCGELALVSSGGRGYVIWLHTSDDDVDLRSFDAGAWFTEILSTVQLRPGQAVD